MKYKKVRTLKHIKADPRISNIHLEVDGNSWWCYLIPGFRWDNYAKHAMNERTIKQICNELNHNVTEWPDDPALNTITLAQLLEPMYLGDGVYCDFDGYHIVLHVNSHPNPVVSLEGGVLANFDMYRKNLQEKIKQYAKSNP